jgi:hypothetical protein
VFELCECSVPVFQDVIDYPRAVIFRGMELTMTPTHGASIISDYDIHLASAALIRMGAAFIVMCFCLFCSVSGTYFVMRYPYFAVFHYSHGSLIIHINSSSSTLLLREGHSMFTQHAEPRDKPCLIIQREQTVPESQNNMRTEPDRHG